MTPAGRPFVFIHGLWLHTSSWAPWTELFQTAGYAPSAPGWPGASDTVEETRSHPDLVAGKGDLYQRWTVPSPAKPLFEAASANLSRRSPAKVNTGNKTRGPLLLIAGGHDHTVPAAITRSTRKLYHKSPAITDLREFNDRGHSLTIDHGWREIADEVLNWLSQRLT